MSKTVESERSVGKRERERQRERVEIRENGSGGVPTLLTSVHMADLICIIS